MLITVWHLSSLSLFIHRSQPFSFQFWNTFCGIARRSSSEILSVSSIFWNRRPFIVDFNFGNKKKKGLQGPNLESRAAVGLESFGASPKIHVQRSGGIDPRIHNLDSRWRWVVTFTRLGRLIPGEWAPGTHWLGGWVGSRPALDSEEQKNVLHPLGMECRFPSRPSRNCSG
jgi:hypothetical protein